MHSPLLPPTWREVAGLLLAEKPAGIATHSIGDGKDGFVEQTEKKLSLKLRVCHRLDKDTSGALIFGLTEQATKEICLLFEKHQIQKRYLFVSNREPPQETEFTYSSHIKKRRGRFVSWPVHADLNATTSFKLLDLQGVHSLWEARPLSGKPHQIRLHAKDHGIPVLGDNAHGGSRFPRLMLHSCELRFQWQGSELVHNVPAPDIFRQLSRLDESRYVKSYFSECE